MGCASSSKRSYVDVYRPAPSSFAVFDITSIQEPWLNAAGENESEPESDDVVLPDYNKKHRSHVPALLLEKLNAIEDADPRTWDEVSKELEHLNKLRSSAPTYNKPNPKPPPTGQFISPPAISKQKLKRKSFSFHTLSELEAKISTDSKRLESVKPEFKRTHSGRVGYGPESGNEVVVPKSLKENMFIVRDSKEREKAVEEVVGLNDTGRVDSVG